MVENFDWNRNAELIVVRSVDAIAVFVAPNGDLVITQAGCLTAEQSMIVLPCSYARSLADAIHARISAWEDGKE